MGADFKIIIPRLPRFLIPYILPLNSFIVLFLILFIYLFIIFGCLGSSLLRMGFL